MKVIYIREHQSLLIIKLDDSKGNFTFELQVYGREYDNDNNLIKVEKTLDGRTSHWVLNI